MCITFVQRRPNVDQILCEYFVSAGYIQQYMMWSTDIMTNFRQCGQSKRGKTSLFIAVSPWALMPRGIMLYP